MQQTKTQGFTLVELLVATGVFAVVAVLITGAYITVLGYARHAEATASATNSLAFALENMTRTIRTGSAYSCGTSLSLGDCSASGNTSLSLRNNEGTEITYEHIAPVGSINGSIRLEEGSALYTITDTAVNITSLKFYLTGSSPTDVLTPTVRIVVTGSVPGYKNNAVTFTLETLAIMRGVYL
jgi:prepilin-type N-terminal cleavage/methylation domain-containing protein